IVLRPELFEIKKLYVKYLQQWLESFVAPFERFIDVFEVPLLPREVLVSFSTQLRHSSLHLSTSTENKSNIPHPLLLIKFFIIVSPCDFYLERSYRNNIFFLLFFYLYLLLTKKSQKGVEKQWSLQQVVQYGLVLCETLFDPYQTWRRRLAGWVWRWIFPVGFARRAACSISW
uniref:Uncharacterized protein n=1 Tax=Nothobranchius furzeri TaxID=105023 RepID=A0A8C6LUM3_NOTFU